MEDRFETYDELPGEPDEYRRKPTATIHAVQMPQSFRVLTLEGEVEGKPGDWLAKGVKGELYPIADKVFNEIYEKVTE